MSLCAALEIITEFLHYALEENQRYHQDNSESVSLFISEVLPSVMAEIDRSGYTGEPGDLLNVEASVLSTRTWLLLTYTRHDEFICHRAIALWVKDNEHRAGVPVHA